MTEKNYFQLAAKRKTRFTSVKGALTAEQLYDLKLTELNVVAQTINGHLKSTEQENFISPTPDANRGLLADALEVVKIVIADKQAEAARAQARIQKAGTRRVLEEALERKRTEKIGAASEEELLAQLKALDED